MLACTLVVLVGLAGCRGLKLTHPLGSAHEEWATEGASSLRQHVTAETLVPPLEEAWAYNAGAGFGAASPLIVDDVVLTATRQGELHAVRLETGKRQGYDSFGEALEGTPAVRSGILYVPVAWEKHALVAYDLHKGTSRWKVRGDPIEAGLLVLDDGLVAADVEGVVRKYGLQTGDVLWERELGAGALVRATPVLQNGQVIVADTQGRLAALDPADGTTRWTRQLPAPVYASFGADAQHLYVPTTRGQFLALDAATGAVRWRVALSDTTVRFTAPAVAEGTVFVGGTDGVLRALDAAEGTERWSYTDDAVLTAPPLVTPEHVFLGTMSAMLYALNRATGDVVWEQEVRGRIKSPMVLHDDCLIVQSEPRHLYCFTSSDEQYASTP